MENKKQTFKITVVGMTCDGCARHVEKELSKIGAEAQIANWQSGEGIVNFSADVEQAKKEFTKALKNTRYKVKEVHPLEPELERKNKIENFSQDSHKTDADLIVIGTGGAGMAAAIEAANQGRNVIIIEKESRIGGTCVNVGCVPSKEFVHFARKIHAAKNVPLNGVQIETKIQLDYPKVVEARKKLVAHLRTEKYEDVLKAYPNIRLIKGTASFEKSSSGLSVKITQGDQEEGITAKKAIIATGSRPHIPDIRGLKEANPLNSTDLLFLEKLPKSLVILGGGFIALELGQAFARVGTQVTILARSRLLSKWDADISNTIKEAFAQEGIKVFEQVQIDEVKRNPNVVIKGTSQAKNIALKAEEILVATGRKANTKHLNLDQVGVETHPKTGSILVNEYGLTTNLNIAAAGDCTQHAKLVYLAAKAGKLAAQNLFLPSNDQKRLDLSIVPEVIFTEPELARVGLSEQEALAKNINIQVSKFPLSALPKAIASRNTLGFIKIIADANSGQILGSQIISPRAGELIHTVALAMRLSKKAGYTIQDLREELFAYLTEAEGIKLAAQTFSMDVSKLSCCAG
ncbi:MAG: mercury(II) reductase [Candidatus Hydrogenedentota bacterium]|nr:MAG: mercury(II) reductase [Candidatus Hydrogenedentota bacterium]